MGDLNRRRQRTAAVAKAARTAIILPGLFGFLLFFVKDAQAAGFAVFGTFAHLVMTNYDPQRKKRLVQVVTLTCCGVVMIAWGTAVSMWLWLAVLSACVVAFTTQTASLFRESIAASRTVVLLAFMLAVTSPGSLVNVVPRLGGWVLSGVVALPVILATWISFGLVNPAQSTTHVASTPAPALADEPDACWGRGSRGLSRSFQASLDTQPVWFANSARAAVAMGLAALIAGVFKLEHGFWIALGILPVLRAGDTAGARTFLQEQGGTLAGFMSSAVLVALVGSHREVYWIALPITAFVAAYVSTAVGFVAGQAAFTLFVVVLLNIVTSLGYRAGILRLEDIAIGGAISLVLGAVYRTHRGLGHVSAPRQHPRAF
jgi:Fusaric acid resistance protein-like